MEIFDIKELSFTYPEKTKKALSHINITIKRGEFVTICGKSGCGKTTLLKHLKTILSPYGNKEGTIEFRHKLLNDIDYITQSSEIGFVFQDPNNQIVTDKVWHELAFGLENLGYDSNTIRLRVAEISNFFGIEKWFNEDVSKLSGGQKQILNLASVMAMQPTVLILDEPTSQLDPVAALKFLDMVKRINLDLGVTIIMTEHRLEEIIPISDRLIVMSEGEIIADEPPCKINEGLSADNHKIYAMTTPMRIYAGVKNELNCPITVNDGRKWLDEFVNSAKNKLFADKVDKVDKVNRIIANENVKYEYNETAIEFKNVWFKYEKDMPFVVKDLCFKVNKGEFYCIMGGNGTGKTTTLSLMNKIIKPYRGKVNIAENTVLGMLPQNPTYLFVEKTIEEDLHEMLLDLNTTPHERNEKIKDVIEFFELEDLLQAHPFDLSGGEQQRAALAKVLLMEPDILVLDEPTKGLDEYFKQKLSRLLKKLKNIGVTIIMVSHDIEFCAKNADRCTMFFNGSIITENRSKMFFSGNNIYTTAANRMVRHVFPQAVTAEEVIELCQKIS